MATKKKADGKTTAKESPVNQDDHRPKVQESQKNQDNQKRQLGKRSLGEHR
jgi:hypothetical protein